MKHCCGAKEKREVPLQSDSEQLFWATGTAPEGVFGLQRKLMRFSCPPLRESFVTISLRDLNVVSAAALAEGPWDSAT